MINAVLIESIFKGNFSAINFEFINKLMLSGARDARFNTPEISSIGGFDQIIDVFKLNEYADFVITTDYLDVNHIIVPKVFINIGRNNEEVELLLFFDLKDIECFSLKDSANLLRTWMQTFKNEYNFDYFICQMDNANENEYYFDSLGLGPLYHELGV